MQTGCAIAPMALSTMRESTYTGFCLRDGGDLTRSELSRFGSNDMDLLRMTRRFL
jgi:hypothetical protein